MTENTYITSQDSLRFRRKAVPASLNMDNHERFYPTKTFVHRRVSGTGTNFDDTDIEDSDSDEEFLRQSMQSVSIASAESQRVAILLTLKIACL